MARPRRRGAGTGVMTPPEGSPQNARDTTAANVDRVRVAARAYELYLSRGGNDGWDLDDWLEAERELTQRAADPNVGRP